MKRFGPGTGLVALVPVCICASVWAMGFSQDVAEPNKTPAGAGPRLQLSTESRSFRCGEVIRLELSFTAATTNQYQINMAQYDRSGRMNYERFLVSPTEGTRDPLQLYFSSIGGYLGGGLTGFKFLSSSPTTIELNLNEWVSFDQPGTYQLTVISRRISDIPGGDKLYAGALELNSNVIELQIIPAGTTWQRAQLAQIREWLDRGAPSGLGGHEDRYQAALSALRYLGTEEAVRELARRLRGDDNKVDWQCMFGLVGSPHRNAGLQEMNKLLDDPAFPVSNLFLNTIAILGLDPAASPETLRKQREETLTALRERLAVTISGKQGKALAVSLDAMINGTSGRLSPELRSQHEGWSRDWSRRASELRDVPGGENPHVWKANLGQTLARALMSGVGWLSDESKLGRIQALGVGPTIHQETEQALQAWLRRPFTITCMATVPPSFSLAQYNLRSMKALKTKLAEFPRGTKFFLPPPGPTASQEELKTLQEILDFMSSPHFSHSVLARRWRGPWIQGARPRAPQTYCTVRRGRPTERNAVDTAISAAAVDRV